MNEECLFCVQRLKVEIIGYFDGWGLILVYGISSAVFSEIIENFMVIYICHL